THSYKYFKLLPFFIGWDMPSDEEWKQLEVFIGMSQADADSIGERGTIAPKLKSSSGWEYIIDGRYYDENGTDDYGFSVLPCGNRHYWTSRTTEFVNLNYGTEFWTSTENSDIFAWSRRFNWSTSSIRRGGYWVGKVNGFSVRCVKDTE
ncbi:MAG: FISUMP domain-containing protein, partial [Fidelibacterota bacterium]